MYRWFSHSHLHVASDYLLQQFAMEAMALIEIDGKHRS